LLPLPVTFCAFSTLAFCSVITSEQNARVEKAQNVTGRGNKVVDQEVIISENYDSNNSSELDQILVLSGVKKPK